MPKCSQDPPVACDSNRVITEVKHQSELLNAKIDSYHQVIDKMMEDIHIAAKRFDVDKQPNIIIQAETDENIALLPRSHLKSMRDSGDCLASDQTLTIPLSCPEDQTMETLRAMQDIDHEKEVMDGVDLSLPIRDNTTGEDIKTIDRAAHSEEVQHIPQNEAILDDPIEQLSSDTTPSTIIASNEVTTTLSYTIDIEYEEDGGEEESNDGMSLFNRKDDYRGNKYRKDEGSDIIQDIIPLPFPSITDEGKFSKRSKAKQQNSPFSARYHTNDVTSAKNGNSNVPQELHESTLDRVNHSPIQLSYQDTTDLIDLEEGWANPRSCGKEEGHAEFFILPSPSPKKCSTSAIYAWKHDDHLAAKRSFLSLETCIEEPDGIPPDRVHEDDDCILRGDDGGEEVIHHTFDDGEMKNDDSWSAMMCMNEQIETSAPESTITTTMIPLKLLDSNGDKNESTKSDVTKHHVQESPCNPDVRLENQYNRNHAQVPVACQTMVEKEILDEGKAPENGVFNPFNIERDDIAIQSLPGDLETSVKTSDDFVPLTMNDEESPSSLSQEDQLLLGHLIESIEIKALEKDPSRRTSFYPLRDTLARIEEEKEIVPLETSVKKALPSDDTESDAGDSSLEYQHSPSVQHVMALFRSMMVATEDRPAAVPAIPPQQGKSMEDLDKILEEELLSLKLHSSKSSDTSPSAEVEPLVKVDEKANMHDREIVVAVSTTKEIPTLQQPHIATSPLVKKFHHFTHASNPTNASSTMTVQSPRIEAAKILYRIRQHAACESIAKELDDVFPSAIAKTSVHTANRSQLNIPTADSSWKFMSTTSNTAGNDQRSRVYKAQVIQHRVREGLFMPSTKLHQPSKYHQIEKPL